MPTYDWITIKLHVDNEALPEFMVETDRTMKTVSCWVPSKAGKKFSVILDAGMQSPPWCVNVYADGSGVASVGFVNKARVSGMNIGFRDISPTLRRSLVFSKLELTDDDSVLQASRTTSIGEIKVVCRYFENLGMEKRIFGGEGAFGSSKKIHEKAKKGLSECIKLGEAEGVPATISFKSKYTETIATFVFRYRPIGFLQAQGIAPLPPRPPSPVAVLNFTLEERGSQNGRGKRSRLRVKQEEALELLSGDDDEEQMLLARLEGVRARKRKQEEAGSSQKRVKREDLRTVFGGEVIDLT